MLRKPLDTLASVVQLAQDCIRNKPLILLGSGASAAYGLPGMWPLGQHLSSSTLPTGISPAEVESWGHFLQALPLSNLEQALTDVSLSSDLTKHVVRTTWNYLNPHDIRIFERICVDRKLLALSKLFQYLFASTAREIHVVTPNYDRLAEYAANAAGFMVYTGFSYGLIGRRAPSPPPKIYEGNQQSRTVSVWKVHGCFGWFANAEGIVTGLPPVHRCPDGMEPVIVTPGIEKYRRTHDEPFRTIMHCADRCMQNAPAYLCVGYGFNDQHLQTLLVERCQNEDVPLVLITQKISATAHAFFASGKCRRFLALEQDGLNTKMFSTEFQHGVVIPNSGIWQLDDFLKLVI